eukprot:scaffold9005_cov53-Attheya_sp.AAC.5
MKEAQIKGAVIDRYNQERSVRKSGDRERIMSEDNSNPAADVEEEDKEFVKLISAEGSEVFVDREIAVAGSETMRAMLEGGFKESEDNTIRFPDISTNILEKVVQYLQYKAKHSNSNARIPEFLIEPEIALELLVAANYLHC